MGHLALLSALAATADVSSGSSNGSSFEGSHDGISDNSSGIDNLINHDISIGDNNNDGNETSIDTSIESPALTATVALLMSSEVVDSNASRAMTAAVALVMTSAMLVTACWRFPIPPSPTGPALAFRRRSWRQLWRWRQAGTAHPAQVAPSSPRAVMAGLPPAAAAPALPALLQQWRLLQSPRGLPRAGQRLRSRWAAGMGRQRLQRPARRSVKTKNGRSTTKVKVKPHNGHGPRHVGAAPPADS